MGRRLFIGDPHGCLDEVLEIIEQFQFQKGVDELYCVGDTVGKGPKEAELMKAVTDFSIKMVRGNHEERLVQAWEKNDEKLIKKKYSFIFQSRQSPQKWIEQIQSWPFYIELDDIIMVHAGLEPGKKNLNEMEKGCLINIRTWNEYSNDLHNRKDPPWFTIVKPEKTVVFGHWAQLGLVNLPGFIGLDTGCVYGNGLTAWCPEENRFYHVNSHKIYAPPSVGQYWLSNGRE